MYVLCFAIQTVFVVGREGYYKYIEHYLYYCMLGIMLR